MKSLFSTLPALFLAAAALPAEVLLNQPLVLIDGRGSTVAGPSAGFKTWDRFMLTNSAVIRRVTFLGAFIDTVTSANNPVAPSGVTWNFELAADNAGNPGAAIDSTALAFSSVTQQFLGSATLAGQPVHAYRFTADLLAPLPVTGGETLWLSIFSGAASANPLFGWLSGSGGDGVSKQLNLNNGNVNTYTDRAMTLEGDTVPEPGSLLLMTAGCVLIGLLRRR